MGAGAGNDQDEESKPIGQKIQFKFMVQVLCFSRSTAPNACITCPVLFICEWGPMPNPIFRVWRGP